MNEITITGNLVNDPSLRKVSTQVVTNFRIAHNHRYRDQGTGDWMDGGTTYIDVSCWRSLAENVCLSLGKGSAVIVSGRLRSKERTIEVDGGGTEKRTYFEIEATSVGPDLSRGATHAFDGKREAAERQEERAVEGALAALDPWAPREPQPV
ncbi:MAG: single-stranded DNA-binding protein [Actinomycetota bacterium]